MATQSGTARVSRRELTSARITMKSYSQLGEDVFCFQNFMNIPRPDVVLFEIGAYDGLTYSNTLALEEFNHCTCVLVEPSPLNVRKIHGNRPRASIHNLAVMPHVGVCEFLGDTPVSGVRSELTQHYIETWDLERSRSYNVLCAPLRVITQIEKSAYIDFLSIDVQGAEHHVLSSMDWRIPVGVICIELEGERPGHDDACRNMLRNLGFEFRSRLHISEFWYQPAYFRSDLLFDPQRKAHGLDRFDHQYFISEWQQSLRDHFY